MITIRILSERRGLLGTVTLPAVPSEGHLIQVAGHPYPIRAVEWVPNATHINALIGRD